MKKTGFTLAELLITLGIIGVIVAILVPAVNNAMPDENKTMYLKTYDTLSDTIKNLASNSQIYPICEQDNNINCSENPLLNTGAPLMSPLRSDERYRGDVKLCNLLALSFGAANSSCSEGDYTYSNDTFKNNLSFITSNGMQWKVVQNRTIADGNATFQADIYVDINGNKGNNRIYSATDTKPDIFKFMVAANGTVVPADPMGRAYLASRKVLLKKNVVIANNNILTNLDDNIRTFAYTPCQVEVADTKEEDCLNQGKYWYDADCHDRHANSIDFSCTVTTINNDGQPLVRSDGYFHNLRTTRVNGIYAELFNPSDGCNDLSVRRHYMYNPDAQKFEYLGTSHVNPGDENGWLRNNNIYQRLANKSKPPFIINGKEYKLANIKEGGGRGNMTDENGNLLPQDSSIYLYRP